MSLAVFSSHLLLDYVTLRLRSLDPMLDTRVLGGVKPIISSHSFARINTYASEYEGSRVLPIINRLIKMTARAAVCGKAPIKRRCTRRTTQASFATHLNESRYQVRNQLSGFCEVRLTTVRRRPRIIVLQGRASYSQMLVRSGQTNAML